MFLELRIPKGLVTTFRDLSAVGSRANASKLFYLNIEKH